MRCVLWQGKVFNGYGVLSGGRWAHRVAYDLLVADPAGKLVDHICHNTLCINPEHLRLTSRSQNMHNRKGASSRSKTGIRGVLHRPMYAKPWTARVVVNGVQHDERYSTVEEAAVAVRRMRAELLGDYAGKG